MNELASQLERVESPRLLVVGDVAALCQAANVAARRPARGKLASLDELVERLAAHREAGRRLAFTNGCFDLLHVGTSGGTG